MYIYFMTLGCKVNMYDTAVMQRLFAEKGHTISETPDNADVCVLNTCTVTSESDSKARKALRRLRREHPDAVIAVTGCYPQAMPSAEALLPEADIVTGTKNRDMLPSLVEDFIEHRERIVYIPQYDKDDPFGQGSCRTVPGHTRAFLKIQDGCDQFCSYCMIPYARGRIRSKPPGDIKAEIAALAESGYREIVLTGINLAFYGKGTALDLADAVGIAADNTGIERIRLSSLEPEMMTDALIGRLADIPKLCPSFHLSLQSGCDRTLAAMNRHYRTADYAALVEKLRERFPGCSVTTDMMAGFPGETDEDHADSLSFAGKMRFSDMHVFPYSLREGTRAAAMEQVPERIKTIRAAQLGRLGEKMHREFLAEQVGSTVPVLFEREKADGLHRGYAPNYTYVKILTKNSEKSLRNQIFYVTIEKAESDCCVGTIVKDHVPAKLEGSMPSVIN